MRIRNRIGAWLLLLVLGIQICGISLLHDLYILDRSTFIEFFCINKDRPEMHCDGSCMISKMKKQQNQESDTPASPKVLPIQVVYFIEQINLDFKYIPSDQTEYSSFNNGLYDFQFLKEIFRPPILS